jgi:hypothetical protein
MLTGFMEPEFTPLASPVEPAAAEVQPVQASPSSFQDFLPAGYQMGPYSSSDPVFQQAYAQWMSTTTQLAPMSGTSSSSSFSNWVTYEYNTAVAMIQNPLSTIGGYYTGLGNGIYNMGVGVYNLGHDLVTMPIDLVGTTVSSTYQPISYYGQASQAAIQNGTPWYYVSGQTAINAGTFGTYGVATTAYQYYQTGDPTAFQQTTGAFAFTVFVAYGVQQYTNPVNAPTYNLGGTGEVPGAINVQPPGAPTPPPPSIIAPSNQLPIPPGSGNIIVNSSPIAPQPGLAALGPPYAPTQISSIATGGYTITITQGSASPGLPTIGQTAVINVVPPGSQIVVTPVPPYSTTVVITTPTPIVTTVAPYAPIVIQGPNPNLIPVPEPQPQAP